ncbi:MAG: hypothetical protein K2M73_05985 [Lachnospiraceae bacterium]|nr:hypothetical protein [Lachnospiraceae bacterium]MDE6699348.1 hypothetical protein [Lachnospiraceae bacterium]
MKKNSPGKDLALLILGMVMVVGGLFLLFNQLDVSSTWGGNITFFGMLGSGVPSGLIVIPLIIGVVLMVIFPKRIWPRIVSGLAVLIIILAIIDSVRITYRSTSFFVFLMIILLIFIGAALCLRILLGTDKDEK